MFRRGSFQGLVLSAVLGLGCGSEARAPAASADDASVIVDARPDTRADLGAEVPSDTNTGIDATDALDGPSDGLLADASDSDPGCTALKTCVGSPLPTWALEDFQPKSPGFKKIYGLSAFKPKVTVVALLAAW